MNGSANQKTTACALLGNGFGLPSFKNGNQGGTDLGSGLPELCRLEVTGSRNDEFGGTSARFPIEVEVEVLQHGAHVIELTVVEQ